MRDYDVPRCKCAHISKNVSLVRDHLWRHALCLSTFSSEHCRQRVLIYASGRRVREGACASDNDTARVRV